jgi:hypothetical protein
MPVTSLNWNAAASNLYAAFNQNYTPNGVYVLSVNSSGLQTLQSDQFDASTEAVNAGGVHYSALTGYLYGDGGAVLDPSSNTVVDQFALNRTSDSSYFPPLLTLDDNLGIAWVLAVPNSGQSAFMIEAFDLRTYALLGSIAIPTVTGTPIKLIRWGTNGLAFLTSGSNGPQQGDGVYLISGAFVTTPSTQLRTAPQ